jgi:TolB-like protein/Flp pilus assembly protein TadD
MAWAWAYAAGKLEEAIAECERGLEINPNCSIILGNLGFYLAALGRSQEAIEACRMALRLNPRDPSNFWRHYGIAVAHFVASDYAAAMQDSKRIARSRPHLPSAIIWAAAAAALDNADEARSAVEYCLARRRDLSVDSVAPNFMLRFARDEDHKRLLELLRKAGLPCEPPPSSASASKPSIAVLPFVNLSGDPEQQYFSDGITEDIITELSRYRSLLVIARNSCFQFRGPSTDIAAVRSKLGVRYVVEGSVRRVGARLHLTARLIDALNESHVWAERYEREAEDIFAVQDDITRAIASTLEGRVAASGAEQARRRPTKDWQAYDYFLQGRELSHCYDFIRSEPYLTRAIELDPGFAQAHAWRAHALLGMYWGERRAELLDEVLQCARTALSLDDADAWCHLTMGFALSHRGRLDLAGPHVERAAALNPTDVHVAILRAWWLARVGRSDEAIDVLDVAMHRDPFPPQWLWECRAIALMQARRHADAIEALGRMSDPHVWDHAYLAACHAQLGHAAEARAAAAEVLRLDPRFTVRRYGEIEWFKNPADHEHLLDGMRMAGLPE